MARPLGDNVLLEIDTDGESESAAGYEPLLCAARASFDSTRREVERTCGGDHRRVYNVTKQDSRLEVMGPYDDENTTLFTHFDSADAKQLRLTPDSTQDALPANRLFFSGLFHLLGFRMEIPVDAGIDLSFSAVAAGEVTTNIPA